MKSLSFFLFPLILLFCISREVVAREPFIVVGPKYIVVDRSYPQPYFDAALTERPIVGTFDLDQASIINGAVGNEMNPLTSAGGSYVPPDALSEILQISALSGVGGTLSPSLRIEGRKGGLPRVAIGPNSAQEVLKLTFSQPIGGLTFTFSGPLGARFDLYVNDDFFESIAISSGNGATGIFDPRGASIRSMAFVGSDRKFLMGQGTIYGDLPPLCEAIPDLLISERKPIRLKGDDVYDRNRPSPNQTITHRGRISMNTRISALLWMENDGGETRRMSLRSSGDRFTGMTAHAQETGKDGRKNIAAALRRGNFSRLIKSGFPVVKVIYSVDTNRFRAGSLRGSNRNDTIYFRMSGAGQSDNAALELNYRGPAGAARL